MHLSSNLHHNSILWRGGGSEDYSTNRERKPFFDKGSDPEADVMNGFYPLQPQMR